MQPKSFSVTLDCQIQPIVLPVPIVAEANIELPPTNLLNNKLDNLYKPCAVAE